MDAAKSAKSAADFVNQLRSQNTLDMLAGKKAQTLIQLATIAIGALLLLQRLFAHRKFKKELKRKLHGRGKNLSLAEKQRVLGGMDPGFNTWEVLGAGIFGLAVLATTFFSQSP